MDFETLSQKTGVPSKYLQLGALGFLIMFFFFGFGASFMANIVGFLYPAYASFQAIESKGKDDDTQWLTYWLVFGVFSLVDQFTEVILQFVPFYHLAKMGFLVWLYLPQTQGAKSIYDSYLRPIFAQYEKQIDDSVKAAGDKVSAASEYVKSTIGK